MLEYYGRLLSDILIRGSSRDHGHWWAPGLSLRPGLEHPGDGVIPQALEPGEQSLGALGLEPCNQNLAALSEAPLDEASELIVGLARGENHFGDAGASLTIGVEAGKTQVVDPVRLQPIEDISDLRLSRGELLQQSSDFVSVHLYVRGRIAGCLWRVGVRLRMV